MRKTVVAVIAAVLVIGGLAGASPATAKTVWLCKPVSSKWTFQSNASES